MTHAWRRAGLPPLGACTGGVAPLHRCRHHPGPSCAHLYDGALCALGNHHEQAGARRRVVRIGRQLLMHGPRRQRGQRPAWAARRRGGTQLAVGWPWARLVHCHACTHELQLALRYQRQRRRRSSAAAGRGASSWSLHRRLARRRGRLPRAQPSPTAPPALPPRVWRVGEQDLEPGALAVVQGHLMQVLYRQRRGRGTVELDVGHPCNRTGRRRGGVGGLPAAAGGAACRGPGGPPRALLPHQGTPPSGWQGPGGAPAAAAAPTCAAIVWRRGA